MEATIEAGEVGGPEPLELWHLSGRVSLETGSVPFDQRLTRSEEGTLVLHAGDARMRIDTDSSTLTVDAGRESLARQLVTTYGLPILLHRTPALLLHACAAIAPGAEAADVICAASGTGKSTLLMGLIAAGWRSVTEDVCVVDLREATARIWPGPPWVRTTGPGPAGSSARFLAGDKTAWDISPWQASTAVGVRRLVFMEKAGGSGVRWEVISTADAIAQLGRAVMWLDDPDRRAAATFGPSVQLAHAIPAALLRLPREDGWVERAESTLRDGPPTREGRD